MWMPRNLCGKTLSFDLGSPIPSSQTMVFSLIAKPSGGTVVTWELQIGIPPRLIHKGMDRPRLLIVIVNGLKKRMDDTKGKWEEELSHVLWTCQTTLCKSIGETPFSMTYEAEAVIPLETGFSTLRMSSFTPSNNDGLLRKSLELIEERRKNTMVQLAYYQHKLK